MKYQATEAIVTVSFRSDCSGKLPVVLNKRYLRVAILRARKRVVFTRFGQQSVTFPDLLLLHAANYQQTVRLRGFTYVVGRVSRTEVAIPKISNIICSYGEVCYREEVKKNIARGLVTPEDAFLLTEFERTLPDIIRLKSSASVALTSWLLYTTGIQWTYQNGKLLPKKPENHEIIWENL